MIISTDCDCDIVKLNVDFVVKIHVIKLYKYYSITSFLSLSVLTLSV